jgi:hypothetical protein
MRSIAQAVYARASVKQARNSLNASRIGWGTANPRWRSAMSGYSLTGLPTYPRNRLASSSSCMTKIAESQRRQRNNDRRTEKPGAAANVS